MFDSNVYKTETKVVAVTKEIEKTISPDKVTEMYDAVRAQAEKDVIASLRVEDNILNGVAVQIADQFDTATSHLYTRFTLNGDEHSNQWIIPTREALNSGQMYDKLTEHYARVVKNVILKHINPVLLPAFARRQ